MILIKCTKILKRCLGIKIEEVPWYQDETAFALFTEINLSIINYYHKKYQFKDICEIGCGYGYITNRLQNEIINGGG